MTLDEQVMALIKTLSSSNEVLTKALVEQRMAFEKTLGDALQEERRERKTLENRVKSLEARLP